MKCWSIGGQTYVVVGLCGTSTQTREHFCTVSECATLPLQGKTVEVGRAYFETDKKRFHILDAPGHAGFVPNMIGGAAQADIAILVISARRGEFETGFEKGGQTRFVSVHCTVCVYV